MTPSSLYKACPRLLFGAFLLIVAIGGFSTADAGDYQVLHWGGNDDPLNFEFAGVARSRDGYLWFGTRLKGLIRFDGVQFSDVQALRGPSLLGQETRNVFVDGEGLPWISVDHHLFLWKQGLASLEWISESQQVDSLVDATRLIFRLHSGSLLRAAPGKAGSRTWEILSPPLSARKSQYCLDRAGAIWYVRTDGRLGRVMGNRCDMISLHEGQEVKRIHVLTSSPEGQIWLGTDRELAVWDGTKFSSCAPANGEPQLNVMRLIFAGAGSLWVEANNRLRRWERGEWVAEARELDPSALPLRTVSPDSAEGGIWINGAKDDQLLHVARDGTITGLTIQMGLSGNLLKFLFDDAHGNLWAGYSRTGLMRIRHTFMRTVGEPEGLTDSWITTVTEDRSGAVWMGTRNSGIARWQDGQCTFFRVPEEGGFGLEPFVSADSQGQIWACTSEPGIWVFRNEHFEQVVTRKRLRQAKVGTSRCLLPFRDGRLFLGALDVVVCYEPAKDKLTEVFRPGIGTRENPVALAEGANGMLWIATADGHLLSHDGQRLMRYSLKNENNQFLSMLAEPDGSVWIGSRSGALLFFRNGAFVCATPAADAPFQRICSIVKDNTGNLWLGTEAGVARVPVAAVKQIVAGKLDRYPFRVFDRNDGMNNEATRGDFQPASWYGRCGRLFFATYKGLCSFDPSELPAEAAPPVPWIEAAQADEKWLDGGAIAEAQVKTAPAGRAGWKAPAPRRALQLGPGLGRLQLGYTAFNYSAPDGVRFRYKLENFDSDWVNAGKDRMARYRHLPPGAYLFHVQARRPGGVWSEPGTAVGFTVLPYYWETVWFRLGLPCLATGFLVAGTFWALQRKNARKMEALSREKAVESERVRIARDIHDEIGAGLTHMALLSELAKSAPGGVEEEHLDGIFRTSKDLVRSLDEIVWSINPAHDSLEHLVSYLAEYAQGFLRSASIACRLDVPPLLPALPVNAALRHHITLAVKEILNNTIKHANATEVRLRIQWNAPELCVHIEDNGQGFGGGDTSGDGSCHDGLINLRTRMLEAGGAFEQTSVPGEGTSTGISVVLPTAQSAKRV